MFYQVAERTRTQTSGALCASDPRPDDWHSTEDEDIQRAKQVCYQCPVLVACLDYSMNNDERFGVWGGLTDTERGFFHKTRF